LVGIYIFNRQWYKPTGNGGKCLHTGIIYWDD
jgi:hypothetical protein